MIRERIFITGGTGYVGQTLIEALLRRGHAVDALVRPGSERKLPSGCRPVLGDALRADSYAAALTREHVFVQLVGVPHPSPAKAKKFRTIDRVAGLEAVRAAAATPVAKFIYLSVAHPAPIMKAYIEVRAEVEERLRDSGLPGAILRPWYVIGPGHWWPLALLPFYWILESWPGTRVAARRLGLVSLGKIIAALVEAIESPAQGLRIIEVPDIRAANRNS